MLELAESNRTSRPVRVEAQFPGGSVRPEWAVSCGVSGGVMMTSVEVKIQREVGTTRDRRVLNARFRDLR